MNCLKSLLYGLLIATVTAGCASSLSGNTYSREEARTVQRVQYGTVKGVRRVNIDGSHGLLGPAAGAIAGGFTGSAIGNGHGSEILAAVGAIAGGLAGAAAETGLTSADGTELTVRLDAGRTIAVVQQNASNEVFTVGERVRVLYSPDATRIAPQGSAVSPNRE